MDVKAANLELDLLATDRVTERYFLNGLIRLPFRDVGFDLDFQAGAGSRNGRNRIIHAQDP